MKTKDVLCTKLVFPLGNMKIRNAWNPTIFYLKNYFLNKKLKSKSIEQRESVERILSFLELLSTTSALIAYMQFKEDTDVTKRVRNKRWNEMEIAIVFPNERERLEFEKEYLGKIVNGEIL